MDHDILLNGVWYQGDNDTVVAEPFFGACTISWGRDGWAAGVIGPGGC